MTTLSDPLTQVLGKKASDTLEKAFGLRTVGDLLRHYPRRYYTRGELTPLDSLREGDHVTVLAKVATSGVIGGPVPGQRPKGPLGRGGPKQRLEVIVTDGTGKLQLAFFAGVRFHAKQLQQGTLALFAGTVSSFRGRRQLVHPEYELLPASAGDDRVTTELAEEFARELIPVYPASAKLTSWTISRHVDTILQTLDAGDDPLPAEVREKHDLWPRELAIRAIHRPTDRADLHRARMRLKWDEAFTMQAALAQRRHAAAAMPAVPRPPVADGIAAAFDERLPFRLTEGQRSVGEVIAHDLACAYPMNRLLQGEVGSGKTVVAVRAMLQVVDAGGQAALLAPTEVLAQQHYRSITALLASGGNPVRWPAATFPVPSAEISPGGATGEALGDPCAQKARTGVASPMSPGGAPPRTSASGADPVRWPAAAFPVSSAEISPGGATPRTPRERTSRERTPRDDDSGRPTPADSADEGPLALFPEEATSQIPRSGGEQATLGGGEQAVRVALLTGSTGVRARRSALSDVFTGDAGILIGTHALLEDQVQFADLGLVVIDEQHRFGVEQRDALREKGAGARPHVLVMTATPIPRTVAMTVFGDLEVSTLSQLPAGRSPVATHVVPAVERPHYLDRAWQRVREEVAAGHQAYVVCPRIGDGEALGDPSAQKARTEVASPTSPGGATPRTSASGADPVRRPPAAFPVPSAEMSPGGATPRTPRQEPGGADDEEVGVQDDGEEARRPPLAVLDVAPELEDGPLAGLRVGIMHGRLVPDEKDRVMTAFAKGELDVLVSTTVIEVGVDVPNATAMVIMDAERFGVSQLHQLRGRVGRGRDPGVCLLVTEAPPASLARERLDAVAATGDGFQLSRLDLQQRREGDVLGSAQAGRRSSLKLLRLLADEDLIATAREEAVALVSADPKLEAHQSLKEAIDDFLGDRRAEFLDKALFSPGGMIPPGTPLVMGGLRPPIAPLRGDSAKTAPPPALWLRLRPGGCCW